MNSGADGMTPRRHADEGTAGARGSPGAHRSPAHRRAVRVALIFALGIALGRLAEPDISSNIWLSGAMAMAILACAAGLIGHKAGRARWALLASAAMLFGAGWYTLRCREAPAHHLSRLLDDQARLVKVEGVLVGNRWTSSTNNGRLAPFGYRADVTRMLIDIYALVDQHGQRRRAAGVLWVRLGESGEGAAAFAPGDFVRLTGFASRVAGTRNPGEVDMRPLAHQRGIAGRITVETAGLIERAGAQESVFGAVRAAFERGRFLLRERAGGWLGEREDESPGRALLASLLLGERDARQQEMQGAFARVGLAHLLAISGLHLGILAWTGMMAVRLTGDRAVLERVAVLLIVALYMLIVPVRAPILRAGVMVIAFVLTDFAGRRYDRVSTLAWAMVLVLLWRPADLFAPGFQLTFGIVAALLLLGTPVRNGLFGPTPERDAIGPGGAVLEWCKSACVVCLCAWLIAAPLTLYHFGYISPLAAPISLVAVPLAAVMLGAGFGAMLFGLVRPREGAIVGDALVSVADGAAWLIRAADAAPLSSVYLPAASLLWTVCATAALAWWMRRGMRVERRGVLVALALACWAGGEFASARLPDRTPLRLDMLAVGNGTCLLVRSGSEAMLYDCGSEYFAVGERMIPRAVRALGAGRVRTVVISHPNLDHYAGLIDVVRPLGVREVLLGEAFILAAAARPDGPEALVRGELERRGVRVRTIAAGERWPLGNAQVEVISPHAGTHWRRDNDASLVLRIGVQTGSGDRTLLLCGDIERDAMRSILEARPGLRADVMEAPHHGSALPAAFAFVESVDPPIVLQSTGPMRLDDERWDEVRSGRTWLVTARDGAISVRFDRDGRIQTGTHRSDGE